MPSAPCKGGIKTKRLFAASSDNYRALILGLALYKIQATALDKTKEEAHVLENSC